MERSVNSAVFSALCVCVCSCVGVYLCIFICVCVSCICNTWLRMWVCIYTCMYVCVDIVLCFYMCMYVCVCMVFVCICVCTCMHGKEEPDWIRCKGEQSQKLGLFFESLGRWGWNLSLEGKCRHIIMNLWWLGFIIQWKWSCVSSKCRQDIKVTFRCCGPMLMTWLISTTKVTYWIIVIQFEDLRESSHIEKDLNLKSGSSNHLPDL